jgi:hypothetical protein
MSWSKTAVFILGGDFNAPDINWQSNNITGAKHYSKKVNQTYLDLAAEHSLEQMVDSLILFSISSTNQKD